MLRSSPAGYANGMLDGPARTSAQAAPKMQSASGGRHPWFEHVSLLPSIASSMEPAEQEQRRSTSNDHVHYGATDTRQNHHLCELPGRVHASTAMPSGLDTGATDSRDVQSEYFRPDHTLHEQSGQPLFDQAKLRTHQHDAESYGLPPQNGQLQQPACQLSSLGWPHTGYPNGALPEVRTSYPGDGAAGRYQQHHQARGAVASGLQSVSMPNAWGACNGHSSAPANAGIGGHRGGSGTWRMPESKRQVSVNALARTFCGV